MPVCWLGGCAWGCAGGGWGGLAVVPGFGLGGGVALIWVGLWFCHSFALHHPGRRSCSGPLWWQDGPPPP